MYIYANPNPQGSYVGDCVIRAIALATNRSWYDVYVDLAVQGLSMSDMPSSNRVWAEYLKNEGWDRHVIPNTCPNCYTVRDFAGEHFRGTYILGTGSHVICVKSGNWLDSWNSGDESPLFYWTKEA